MAQEVPLAINKVEYGGNTLIDITDTTATSPDVLNGKVFYNADGTRGVGSLTVPDISNLVYTEVITLASNLSVNANTNTSTATYTLTPRTNYTAIMVTLENVYNGAINLWYCHLEDNKIAWRVRNVSSSKATGVSIRVCVLYIKTGCVAT